MARQHMWGAEVYVSNSDSGGPDVGALTGTVTRDTATKRTGAASYKCDSTGANATAFFSPSVLGTLNANGTLFLRAYYNFAALPGSTVKILRLGVSTPAFSIKLTSGGKLQLFNENAGTQIGSDSSATLVAGTWYRIELSGTVNAGVTQWTAVEARVDGVTIASTSGLAITINASHQYGWIDAPGASKVVNIDDGATNNESGSVNNSWCGDGSLVMMCPISDNARGAWTGGAGGTTNLFDAVNNTPPVGVAEASATNTSQIKNRTTTNPTSYDGNLDTYTNAGVSGTVNAIQIWDNDGEDPATGTKTGASSMVSNPAIAEGAAFNFGDDAGLQGTYVGNWKWHKGTMTEAPSVTLGTAPVIRIRCISGATGSRSASCAFLGAYVDYTPPSARDLPYPQPTNFQDPGMFAKAHDWFTRKRNGIWIPDELWTPVFS